MSKSVALNPVDHKDLRIRAERSDAMGDDMMCCITFPEEFRNLQNHYPILFQQDPERSEFRCLVLMGFENGENLYLKDGNWDAGYVPLAMDIQPFMIGISPDNAEDRKVIFNPEDPRIGKGEGTRVFDDNGAPTAYLDSVSKKLGYLDGGYKNSSNFIEALKKYDLLEPLTIDIQLKDGSKNRLAGFHTIHEERLNQLEPAALAEFQEKGYLMPSYMVLASLSNLNALIARKNATTVTA